MKITIPNYGQPGWKLSRGAGGGRILAFEKSLNRVHLIERMWLLLNTVLVHILAASISGGAYICRCISIHVTIHTCMRVCVHKYMYIYEHEMQRLQ